MCYYYIQIHCLHLWLISCIISNDFIINMILFRLAALSGLSKFMVDLLILLTVGIRLETCAFYSVIF
jgi:hypothetical protein